MAELRCPNCGKSNSDLLDVCQFCQTPLKSESVLRIGEKPTKKNTGELEPILPDWLKDVRQQARNAAEEDAAQAETHSKTQSNQPPDLLAGLASQAGSGEEEDVPDWLASLNPTDKSKSSTPSAPEPVSKTPQEDTPSWMKGMRDQVPAPAERDELSEWLAQASEGPEEIAESGGEQSDTGWGSPFDLPSASTSIPPAKEEEDLSWLHNLEAASKQTGELETPKQEMDWKADFEMPSTPSQPSASHAASQQDLSWLDRLGGIDESSRPATEQPAAPHPPGDLSWLDQFGGISAPPQTSKPAAPQDPSWVNNLGSPSEPQPVDAAPNQPISTETFVSGEDLDWLNKLGGGSEPVQPVRPPVEDKQPAEDLSWLNQLDGKPEELAAPPFTDASGPEKVTPRQTAPLNKEAQREPEPDWLRRATEAPSMPAPGDLSMDWFSGSGQSTREKAPPSTPKATPFESDPFSTASEPASLSNEDVDSLFSVEMPDWLSRAEPEAAAPPSGQTGALPTESDESLAPVDLPSWVQAMRPVESVISETASSVADQPAETEGPLAGLHGVIPIAPIGSSRRPKPVSLTLQAPPEQQASAALLEQILGSETSPRALVASSAVASQQWLRWALSALILLVLSSVILLRSQIMPVSADPSNLPVELSGLSNAILSIPANAKVLVVIDYEPSLAGELEAVSSPLLGQIVLLSQPNLSFVSTSPNGPALAERLMANINQAGMQYRNLGYLPGGSAGVLGFMEAPGLIVPLADVTSFSEYAALVVLTDRAESGRVWVEQMQNRRQADPALTNQPLLMVASAQAGPLLQPYVSSRQITGMISGLSDAARYEASNGRPGIARSYWDTFGFGLMMSIALIIIGSLWSLFTGLRARRANAEQG